MNKEFLQKAEKSKPVLTETVVSLPCNKGGLSENENRIFDFGNHYVGYVTINFRAEGGMTDSPALLRIRFAETREELDENFDEYRGWISKAWLQEEKIHIDEFPCVLSLPRRYAFRYVDVEIVSASRNYKVVIDGISARTVSSANREVKITGDTEQERLIDKAALRTLYECMQYEFEDGPKRDKRLWLGDLRLQALVNYATYKNNDLVKRCLYLFAGTANDEGRISACVYTRPEIKADNAYTMTLDSYIFVLVREQGNFAISSAAGLIQAFIGFVLVVGANLILRKVDSESSLF